MIAIVAYDHNHVIGINGKLPWRLKDDLKHFKQYTYNNIIIMGRVTYESIGQPLPNRTNIILTKDNNYRADGCLIYTDVATLVRDHLDAIVIGGAIIYKTLMPYIDTIIATEVDSDKNYIGDIALFPYIDDSKWNDRTLYSYSANDDNQYSYIIKEKRKHPCFLFSWL
jgi:dihydrofolate reductase